LNQRAPLTATSVQGGKAKRIRTGAYGGSHSHTSAPTGRRTQDLGSPAPNPSAASLTMPERLTARNLGFAFRFFLFVCLCLLDFPNERKRAKLEKSVVPGRQISSHLTAKCRVKLASPKVHLIIGLSLHGSAGEVFFS
jgi:hypothetical protein